MPSERCPEVVPAPHRRAREVAGSVPVEVIEGQVDQWPSIMRRIRDYQLAVIDTAPGVEHDMSDMLALCKEAALV